MAKSKRKQKIKADKFIALEVMIKLLDSQKEKEEVIDQFEKENLHLVTDARFIRLRNEVYYHTGGFYTGGLADISIGGQSIGTVSSFTANIVK